MVQKRIKTTKLSKGYKNGVDLDPLLIYIDIKFGTQNNKKVERL